MTRRPSPPVGRLAAAVLAVGLALAATGCGSSTSGAAGNPGSTAAVGLRPIAVAPTPQLPVTVASVDGTPVTVTDVSRVLPLSGSLSESVFALGLGDHVVGRDISATFPEAKDLPLVTRAHDVSPESALSLRPTLVLAQADTGPPEALDQIRAAGVPIVVVAQPSSIDDTYDRIEAVAAALGVPDAGAALVTRTKDEVAQAQQAIPERDAGEAGPRVAFLYLRGSAGVYLIGGKGSGADSMIDAAGAVDAGTAMGLERPFTPLTSEAMAQAAPDVILMTSTGLDSVGGLDGLVAIPGIAQTPAGQNRRVITEEDGLLYSFGSRTPEALAQLIDELYATP